MQQAGVSDQARPRTRALALWESMALQDPLALLESELQDPLACLDAELQLSRRRRCRREAWPGPAHSLRLRIRYSRCAQQSAVQIPPQPFCLRWRPSRDWCSYHVSAPVGAASDASGRTPRCPLLCRAVRPTALLLLGSTNSIRQPHRPSTTAMVVTMSPPSRVLLLICR